jgi:hypothetical protein
MTVLDLTNQTVPGPVTRYKRGLVEKVYHTKRWSKFAEIVSKAAAIKEDFADYTPPALPEPDEPEALKKPRQTKGKKGKKHVPPQNLTPRTKSNSPRRPDPAKSPKTYRPQSIPTRQP